MTREKLAMCTVVVFAIGVMTVGTQPAWGQSTGSAAPETPTAGAAADSSATVNAPAVVPQLIKFSGTLVNLAGKPITGAVDVTFSLYSQESGGTPLWFETQTVQADSLGRYTALLGAMTPTGVPMELFASGEAHWLGVQVSNLPEQPRVLLVSVPYAMKAGDAQTLGGRPASAFQLTADCSGDVSSATCGAVTSQTGGGEDTAATGATAGRMTARKGTTTTPRESTTNATKRSITPLAVSSGPTNFTGATADQVVGVTQTGSGTAISAAAPSNDVIVGTSTSATGAFAGVKGVSNSPNGAGVSALLTAAGGWALYGRASATTGPTVAAQGINDSDQGTAMSGWERATSGATIGLVGSAASTGGIGLKGRAYATSGATTGILATVSSPAGTGLVINNIAGGKLFSGQNNGVETISMTAAGGMTTAGAIEAAGGFVATTSGPAALYGVSNGFDGTAVTGIDNNGSDAWGVYGASSSGFAGVFDGNVRVDSYSPAAGNLTVDGSVGIGTSAPRSTLELQASVNAPGPGPILTLTNTQGNGTSTSVDFNTYTPSNGCCGYNPTARMQVVDDNWSGDFEFLTNVEGGPSQGMDNQVEITKNGQLIVDASHNNDGTVSGSSLFGASLVFGGAGSGEAIASCRADSTTCTVNNAWQYGLNFYTAGSLALAIANNHDVYARRDLYVNGCFYYAGGSLGSGCSSDARLKTDIQAFPRVLDQVTQLQPVHFNWRASNPAGYPNRPERQSGLIAQQVEKVFPDMVSFDEHGFRRVNYSELPFLTLEGVRELKALNDSLHAEVGQQQAEIARLNRSSAAKDARLNALAGQLKAQASQNRKLTKEVEELRKTQSEIAALEARLSRDEARQQATRPKLARVAPGGKKQSHTEIARVKF
jgi:hypothetical protein